MYRLTIENVGKIKSASVQLGGLTVLTGFNDIGKSTIGKVAWSLVDSMLNAPIKLIDETEENLDLIAKFTNDYSINYFTSNIAKYNNDELKNTINSIRFSVSNMDFLRFYESDNLSMIYSDLLKMTEFISEMIDKMNMDLDDKDIVSRFLSLDRFKKACYRLCKSIEEKQNNSDFVSIYGEVFLNTLIKTFIGQSLSRTSASKIILEDCIQEPEYQSVIDFDLMTIAIVYSTVECKRNVHHVLKYNSVTMVDSPLVVNFRDLFTFEKAYSSNNRSQYNVFLNYPIYVDLIKKLETIKFTSRKEVNFDESDLLYNSISQKVKEIINGEWKWNEQRKEIVFNRDNIQYHPLNVASGIKAFGVLQLLAEADLIRPDSLLILDEPESHLHPEWEVKYGELLVWLATQGIPIIVSTHSSYVLQAIYKYADRYGAEDLVSYYVGEEEADGSGTVFTDVTDNVSEVFHKNSVAMQKLLLM